MDKSDYTQDKLLGIAPNGDAVALSYEADEMCDLIVLGSSGSGKTDNWVIPNTRWLLSKATIITDKGLSVKNGVDRWDKEIGNTVRLPEIIFDADREDCFKYNPFASDFGDAYTKVKHLARAFMSASKGVANTEDFYCVYVALVCAVYFGVTSTKNNLEGLKDTVTLGFDALKGKISDFYKESEQTYAFSPSFMEWLKRFLALPYDEATKMYDFVTAGLSPFFTDSAIRMSNTYENVILKLDTTAYRMYVNLKEDKYSTTNAMFAVFFDNILDRHLFFNSFDEQMNRRIYPYKHYILDDIDLIPLSPRVKKNLPRVDRLGVTTTILASHAADVKSYLSLTDKVLLMGGNTDEKDIKYLSERFKVDADTISEYAVYDNALFFEDGKDMLILNKLGSRGVF